MKLDKLNEACSSTHEVLSEMLGDTLSRELSRISDL